MEVLAEQDLSAYSGAHISIITEAIAEPIKHAFKSFFSFVLTYVEYDWLRTDLAMKHYF